jgi:hypothetical protein
VNGWSQGSEIEHCMIPNLLCEQSYWVVGIFKGEMISMAFKNLKTNPTT